MYLQKQAKRLMATL